MAANQPAYTTTNQKQMSVAKKIVKRMYNRAGAHGGCIASYFESEELE